MWALPLRHSSCRPVDRLGRRPADDELAGHPADVPAGDGGGEVVAERHVLGDADAEVEGPRHVGALEVLADVAEHVVVAGHRREGVDEAEQLGLERRPRHRPVDHPLGERRPSEQRRLPPPPSSAMRRARARTSSSSRTSSTGTTPRVVTGATVPFSHPDLECQRALSATLTLELGLRRQL